MELFNIFLVTILISIILIPLVNSKLKSLITFISIAGLSVISSIWAVEALIGQPVELLFNGTQVTGNIQFRIDALSAWFILMINFTFLTGIVYGAYYMKVYCNQTSNLSLHWIAYIIAHASLIGLCSIHNSIAFLILWEVMALSTFLLVIFEHQKHQIMKAGMNYLIQSHISILFLTLAFIGVIYKVHSLDFSAIREFSLQSTTLSSLIIFFCFFIGFALKAGFVPFHTWLPYAHPAAPSHVSGVMSGVIIKIGIYGILRMLYLMKTDYTAIGYIILTLSVITGVYGVMLAIIQHNLKRLLAYHSIENIGIIGIGIGIGCIGLGDENIVLASMGFAGALLHTLNHSLFKSLLFYGAGNVYQATHTMNIEQLGGLGKKMPYTALLFLVGSIAISGLPPFNGFISEFTIYNSLFTGMSGANLPQLLFLIFPVLGLALIGGLAIMCFTKAFGTIFLGLPRNLQNANSTDPGIIRLIPMFLISFLILVIGLFPRYFFNILSIPVAQFTDSLSQSTNLMNIPGLNTVIKVGYASLGFICLAILILIIRFRMNRFKPKSIDTTWGCGYVGATNKMQYTASSFVRQFRKLAEPVLSVHKFKQEISGIFPGKGGHETHPKDKIEEKAIKYPLKLIRHFLNKFTFLQSGNPQVYVIYGVVFITLIMGIPFIITILKSLIQFMH